MASNQKNESTQFARQWALPDIDDRQWNQLAKAKILMVGAGGLGHPVAAYLASCGIARLTIMDHDIIQRSNLPRQFYFGVEDLGLPKVNILARKLNKLNGQEICVPVEEKLHLENLEPWISGHDLVVDCSDSMELKYLLSSYCKIFGKPLVMGSVDQWQGQLLVIPDRDSAGFHDFFPPSKGSREWGNCASNGVMGPVVGVIGSWMANEVIKIILGLEEIRKNRMIIFDGLAGDILYIRHHDTSLSNTSKPEHSFGNYTMKSILYAEMKQWQDEGKSFQLIDVREQYEFDEFNIGGELIPMNTVPDHVEAFSRELPVVVHCKAGSRSATVIRFLEEQYGFNNLYNLEGGVLAVREFQP
jgi:sulfur-carrier protein adenylyltransferase/sulfurtransferase